MAVQMDYYKMKQIQADTLTPISIFQAISGAHKVLFESNAKHEESGRYSFIALNPIASLEGDQSVSVFHKSGETSEFSTESVLDVLKKRLPKFDEELPFSFFGGAIGHFNYETAFHIESIGDLKPSDLNVPDVHVLFYDTFIVVDHLYQTASICAIDLWKEGRSEDEMNEAIELIAEQIQQANTYSASIDSTIQFEPIIAKETFIEMVEQAKEHIVSGNLFQIVLSQRFKAAFDGNPFDLYRKLRTANASPYMFYLEMGAYTILGTSPESLVKINGRLVTTNPIAGTKPRGHTREEDYALAEALIHDEKELAEHKMLVDLGRNDIGKIAEINSVQVTKYMQIERYKHVMHIVSEVTGKLLEGQDAVDVIKACLPAGTVSGAPKIRAMQIINELEATRRGIYAGAIGYISASGDMDLALAIRTMIVNNETAYVQAGAGIVYDSDPNSEYEETWNKARALLEVQG